MSRHAVGEPNVTTNHRVVADGDAAQQRGVGINRDIIFQNRVARMSTG